MTLCTKTVIACALAFASSNAVNAAVVDFEDKQAFFCGLGGGNSSGGLNYTAAFADCYYSVAHPADFPTPLTSTVMATGFEPTLFTRPGGAVFNLSSVDLAFGPFDHGGLQSDTTTVTGTLLGGGKISSILNVGFGFQTFQLGWNNLVSVDFSVLAQTGEYLAFDNIVYNAVPEPASWMMLLFGFGFAGAVLRRRRTDRVVSC